MTGPTAVQGLTSKVETGDRKGQGEENSITASVTVPHRRRSLTVRTSTRVTRELTRSLNEVLVVSLVVFLGYGYCHGGGGYERSEIIAKASACLREDAIHPGEFLVALRHD